MRDKIKKNAVYAPLVIMILTSLLFYLVNYLFDNYGNNEGLLWALGAFLILIFFISGCAGVYLAFKNPKKNLKIIFAVIYIAALLFSLQFLPFAIFVFSGLIVKSKALPLVIVAAILLYFAIKKYLGKKKLK